MFLNTRRPLRISRIEHQNYNSLQQNLTMDNLLTVEWYLNHMPLFKIYGQGHRQRHGQHVLIYPRYYGVSMGTK